MPAKPPAAPPTPALGKVALTEGTGADEGRLGDPPRPGPIAVDGVMTARRTGLSGLGGVAAGGLTGLAGVAAGGLTGLAATGVGGLALAGLISLADAG